MLDAPLHRDRVVALDHPVRVADRAHAVLIAQLLGQKRRGREDAVAVLREDLGERAVLELRDQPRLDSVALEPLVERATQLGLL